MTPIFSQNYTGGLDMLPHLEDFYGSSKKTDPELIEAFFIETVFVKPLLESRNQIKVLYDNEDDEDFLDTSTSDQFFNALYSKEIAKMIAKQNVLGLKKQIDQMKMNE